MFKKIFSVLVTVIISSLIISSNVSAVEVWDDIYTGMTFPQVKEALNFELNHYETSRGIRMYSVIDETVFFAFSECDNKLMYTLFLVSVSEASNYEFKIARKIRGVVKDGISYYRINDLGYKFKPYGERNLANIWIGSISRWNNFAMSCGDSTKLFPKHNSSIN